MGFPITDGSVRTKNNFIVMTGGPGSGKTTLLKRLSGMGYRYVEESGRRIIRERKGLGLPARPEPEEFARQMFRLDSNNYLGNMQSEDILFFDRSFMDSAWLLAGTDSFSEKIREAIRLNRFCRHVFMIPPWQDIYCNDNERDQTYAESVAVYEGLYKWYELNGYTLVLVPRVSVDERIQFILQEVRWGFGSSC